jgi:small-conductance mechanosensitive channel
MEPTVLAGPVVFSPAEIALFVAILAGLFVLVMAPGWALVGVAAHRRQRARRPGPAKAAAAGGAFGGLLVCCAVSGLVGAVGANSGAGVLLAVLGSWAACAALAWWLAPRARSGAAVRAGHARHDEGWGR